jgi:ABC-type transport system involved in cytochrome bd biosynthesis fused ATPase/permease subunit
VILVTHQLQYLEQADLIVVLKNGEIQVMPCVNLNTVSVPLL